MAHRLTILTFLLLAGAAVTSCGASPERTIKDEIAKANHCETAADCVDASSKCPFGCHAFVNAAEASRIKGLIEGYQSTCTYSCVAIDGVDCVANTCVAREQLPAGTTPSNPAVAEPNTNPDGNAGAPCTTDDECVTPATYLVRSTCPFTSWCVEGRCAVVCPMMEDGVNAETGHPNLQACETASDCDCTRFPGAGGTCSCIEGMCGSLMDTTAQD